MRTNRTSWLDVSCRFHPPGELFEEDAPKLLMRVVDGQLYFKVAAGGAVWSNYKGPTPHADTCADVSTFEGLPAERQDWQLHLVATLGSAVNPTSLPPEQFARRWLLYCV